VGVGGSYTRPELGFQRFEGALVSAGRTDEAGMLPLQLPHHLRQQAACFTK
jgi:hypothetical protein